MRIRKEKKLILCGFSTLLGLEILADGLPQHSMTKIFFSLDDGNYSVIHPMIGIMIAMIS